MNKDITKVKCENGKVIIEIDQSALIKIINNGPYGLKIIDEKAFFEYLQKNLTVFGEGENGRTQFYSVFDDLALDAFEFGEDFVN